MTQRTSPAHVIIIGGGATGAGVAHDLTLRGIHVTLLERGELTSGTTGRHHGLLHSGARYAVSDRQSAVECIEENRILRAIAPGSFEENGGLFVALTDEDMDYLEVFLDGCAKSGIPTVIRKPAAALALEPNLNPAVKMAVEVPDATVDPMRLVLRFFATARHGGADLRPFTEVTGLLMHEHVVTGVLARDYLADRDCELRADLVVNAAGPWSGQVGAMAGVNVPMQPSPGVLLALRGRLCDRVLNRLHKSGDGDIIVPQRELSVVGTSSWVVEDPDDISVPEDHVAMMYREGAMLIPEVAAAPRRAAWSAVRPLVGGGASSGRELSRTFECFDHQRSEGIGGLLTITGGKATTLRAMGEAAADMVCARLGLQAACRTRQTVLLPHTAYYEH
ncbi:MAG: FAD-dependent oxidoreductase [Streptosporangiaceae bacterium]